MPSSPDPLNDSPTFQSPAKPRRSSRVRHSLPLEGSSPTKQTFELDVGNQISPQKIRVTVEAGSDTENGYTHFVDGGVGSPSPFHPPISRRRERTTTTTVPVKGLSDSEDEQVATPKRGRGRPRKSGTPVPAKKGRRPSTPIRKNNGRRKSIGDLVDGDDSNDIDFHIGQGVEIGRGKGRSRSRSIKGASRKSTPAAKQVESSDRIVSSTISRKGRGRRKTLLPEEVMVLEDEDSGDKMDGVGHQSAEIKGALEPIDTNGPLSTYSTIRSTTTIGEDEEDVVVARFDPGNETPHRTGWSSPRIIDAPRPSSSVRRASGYPSPCRSSDKSTTSQHERIVGQAPISSPRKQSVSASTEGAVEDGEQYEEENEDEVGELREFDTILESEGFSMISVDSVPSLREHLSSPTNQAQEEEPASPIRNKHLMAVQGKQPTDRDDSFSSIPDEILRAATPGRKSQNPNLLSVQPARMEDSFSSIPPEILEAATPAKKSQISKLLSKNSNSRIEDSFSSIAPEILEAATPARTVSKLAVSAQHENKETYEDSFSAIPSAILDAATPAPVRQMLFKAQNVASEKLNVPGPSTVSGSQSGDPSSASPRLLTPDETPSPGEVPVHQKPESNNVSRATSVAARSSRQDPGDESSLVHSHMASSPPAVVPRRYTYTAHLRQHRLLHQDITQTPSIVFSSPSLPPPVQPIKGQPAAAGRPEPALRPSLSPIVRAGRVLQDKIVPSSSPRARAFSLGSPFKSPVTDRKSPSVAQDSNPLPLQDRHASQFPGLDLNSNLSAPSSRTGNSRGSTHQDDPFRSNSSSQQRSPSPEEKQSYSLELPEQRHYVDTPLTNIVPEGDSIRSDDAMSWQAGDEVPLSDAATSSANKTNSSVDGGGSRDENHPSASDGTEIWERKWAAERAAVSKKIASADSSQVIVIDSDDDDNSPVAAEDDEDFGLLLETLNSSSPAIPQYQKPSKENGEKPRRSKLPSPWRKNSKRLVYSDELSHISSPEKPAPAVATRVFGSKESSQPVTVRHILTTPQTSDDIEADLSGWQIPQKSNFKPRVRSSGNLDLSAMLASSPVKRLPVLSTSSQRPSLHQPSSNNSDSAEESNDDVSSTSMGVKENTEFRQIPQKMGFQPRVRDSTSGSLASSPSEPTSFGIFGGSKLSNKPTPIPSSSSATRLLTVSSPSRTNMLPYPSQLTPSAQVSPTLNSSYQANSSSLDSVISHDEKENRKIDNRTLKWTQSVHLASTSTPMPIPLLPSTSPTKSCLRSPLKTPSNPSSTSPSKTVAFVSSSPISSSPPTVALSATKWSRDHWLLLDSVLQSWKPENQSPETRRRRNSTRVISKLLGKTIRAQGEELRLEQWHLEVVDEFREKVPGWEEGVVARRVFALLVGEERRGLNGKGKGEFEGEGKGVEV